jgi:hypothetical protein
MVSFRFRKISIRSEGTGGNETGCRDKEESAVAVQAKTWGRWWW